MCLLRRNCVFTILIEMTLATCITANVKNHNYTVGQLLCTNAIFRVLTPCSVVGECEIVEALATTILHLKL